MGSPQITIKIGGRAASDKQALSELVREISGLRGENDFILVHGGGAEVSKVTKIFGLEPTFRDGIRMTSPEEMDIVDMVLAGKMNKYIVRMFNLYAEAVGISGSDGKVFTGACIECGEDEVTCTGKITRVDTSLLKLLLSGGYIPVVSSTSMDETGQALNINADEAALALASALPSTQLIFLSDVPGILKENKLIPHLTKKDVFDEISRGVISGGMIPKVNSSLAALESGVKGIIIGKYEKAGDLKELLSGKTGSRITLN